MSDEDREWLRSVFKRSVMAHKLRVEGQYTEEEQRKWERLYDMHPEEYKQLLEEYKK